MAAYDFAQRLFQEPRIERPIQANRERNIVLCWLRVHLAEKPKPLLRKGQLAQSPLIGPGANGRPLALLLLVRTIDDSRLTGNGRVIEELAELNIHAKQTVDARNHACRPQGMPANSEKIVVSVHL